MKKTIAFLFLCMLSTMESFSQHSCCTSTAELAFYSDKSFIDIHLPPLPFEFVSESGKMITLKAPDGSDAAAYEVIGSQPSNIILMFHEWWGLNDYIKQEAVKLSNATSASVIALDLFDGQVAADPEQASTMAKKLDDERARAIISGAIDYAGRNKQIQTFGWCMGGKWSLQAALMAGPATKGCVMYYGMPETDRTKLSKLAGPVLGIFAKKDQHITPEVVSTFQKNMAAVNKKLTVHNYDADHAFANPSNPQFDKAATADAMQKSIAFLKNNFGEGATR